jgi:transcription antitermination factor NusG
MATISQPWDLVQPTAAETLEDGNWYALQTRARHEKMVEQRLLERGVTTFLPVVTEVHRWSDRKKTVQVPLFNCYMFARLAPTNTDRLRVLRVDGVLGLVGGLAGAPYAGAPIPEEQIEAVRMLVEERMPWAPHPFLKIGQRVRVRGGALDGMEGILVGRNGNRSLVISVDAIQRSIAVSLAGYSFEAV